MYIPDADNRMKTGLPGESDDINFECKNVSWTFTHIDGYFVVSMHRIYYDPSTYRQHITVFT